MSEREGPLVAYHHWDDTFILRGEDGKSIPVSATNAQRLIDEMQRVLNHRTAKNAGLPSKLDEAAPPQESEVEKHAGYQLA